MAARNVGILLIKEWRDIWADKILVFSLLLIPTIFTTIPLLFFYILRSIPISGPTRGLEVFLQDPQFAGVAPDRVVQMLSVNQFLTMFLILPLAIPSVIAAHGIVGEKSAHTLEPLLATPITVRELLLGKCLAAAIPAVLLTWISYAIFAGCARLLIHDDLVFGHIVSRLWLGGMCLMVPLASFLSIGLTLIVSARAEDARAAQQLSGILVFVPVAGLMMQTAGKLFLDVGLFVRLSLALLLLDVAVLWLGSYLFSRESILCGK